MTKIVTGSNEIGSSGNPDIGTSELANSKPLKPRGKEEAEEAIARIAT
jgi:hypothetical protein